MALNEEHVAFAEGALEEVRGAVGGRFCLPRFVREERGGGKRKREGDESRDEYGEVGVDHLLEGLACADLGGSDESSAWRCDGDTVYHADNKAHVSSGSRPWTGFHTNPTDERRTLTISHAPGTDEDSPHPEQTTSYTFHIPPRCTFHLTHLTPSSPHHLRTLRTPRHFDLLLLDPPWPNRSSRRRRPYSATHHAPAPSLPSLLALLRSLVPDLTSTYIAMWLTNAPAVRRAVLGVGGLFEEWNVEVVEEWVWVKVTEGGCGVYGAGVGGLWRRGWECLVVGRLRGAGVGGVDGRDTCGEGDGGHSGDDVSEIHPPKPKPQRRAILAVPDVHSRKPCLKPLFEELLPLPHFSSSPDCRGARGGKDGLAVCEVFARHLTEGWMCVGDECLKDMWVRGWRGVEGASE